MHVLHICYVNTLYIYIEYMYVYVCIHAYIYHIYVHIALLSPTEGPYSPSPYGYLAVLEPLGRGSLRWRQRLGRRAPARAPRGGRGSAQGARESFWVRQSEEVCDIHICTSKLRLTCGYYIYIYIFIYLFIHLFIHLFIYTCVLNAYTCIFIYVYVYVYRYGEREREGDIYIYIYVREVRREGGRKGGRCRAHKFIWFLGSSD